MNTKNTYSIGLTIFRVLICFIIIKNMCFYIPMADEFFGVNAIFPFDSYVASMEGYGMSYLTYPFDIPLASQLYLIGIIILATCYMLAVGGRFCGVLLYLSIISLKVRNGFILDGSDNVIQVTLPFLVLADHLDHFRLFDKKKPSQSKVWRIIANVAVVGLMIQVCFVYFYTALAKLQGDLWLNGTATYYTMRVRDFMATDWNVLLTQSHYFVVLTTYFTLLWELSFPFLIWFKRTKFFIILGGILLHIGIWLFMRIDNFSWVMISTYFVFVSDKEYAEIKAYFINGLTIYIDGWCPNCVGFAKSIKKVDTLDLITVENIRNYNPSDNEIDIQKGLNHMASITENGKIFYGFNSLYQIHKSLPLFWIFMPITFLLKITRLGHLIYNEFAIKRKIIPIYCNEECLINESQ